MKKFDTIGEAIKDALADKGISQSKLSKISATDPTLVSRWVNDINTPSTDSRFKIQNAIGVKFSKVGDKWTYVDAEKGFSALIQEQLQTYQPASPLDEPKNEGSDFDRGQISSNRIRSRRKTLQMSLQELADKMGGLHHTTVGKWEQNLVTPSIEQYEKLAGILHVSLPYIMAIDHYPAPIQQTFVLGYQNLNDLRQRLTHLQAQGTLYGDDYEALHDAIGVITKMLRTLDS